MNKKYKVTGMTCSACSSRVEKCVGKLDGVNTVSVNLLTNSMQIDFDESKLTEEKIADSVTQAGYGMEIPTGKSEKKEEKEDIVEKNIENMKKHAIWSFIFLTSLDVCGNGTHGRTSTAFLFKRRRQRSVLCIDTASFVYTCVVYQQSLF